jgi:hypothetical protein
VVCPRHIGFFCLALLAIGGGRAEAFECKRSDKYDWISLRWNQRVIPFWIEAGINAEISHIEQSFGTWSANDCTDIRFEYQGLAQPGEDVDNEVKFITSNWASPEGRDPRPIDAVAVTLTTYTKDDGEIRGGIIEVNAETFLFDEVTETCDVDNTYDLISVVTHEAGHFIGLDHTALYTGARGDPTMAPRVGVCEADKRTLERDDIEALCLIYPRGQAARSCMPLPSESEYVTNTVFGCSAVNGQEGAGWLTIAAFSWLLVRRRRQNLR